MDVIKIFRLTRILTFGCLEIILPLLAALGIPPVGRRLVTTEGTCLTPAQVGRRPAITVRLKSARRELNVLTELNGVSHMTRRTAILLSAVQLLPMSRRKTLG